MSSVRFIGCLHLGHENLATRLRGFKNSLEHDNYLIEQWNSVVNKKDIVYILGDITMETSEHYYKLDLLKGRKKVILGNHDKGKDIQELLNYVETIEGMTCYKDFWLTHAPVHPQELMFVKGNIHAHIHNMNIPETEVTVNHRDIQFKFKSSSGDKYYNVDAHLIDYKPKTLSELGLI